MRRIATVCLVSLALAGTAHAQAGAYDAVLQDGTRIAAQGDPAPGGGTYTSFGNVRAGGTGDVAYRALVSGGSATEGVFRIEAGLDSAVALSGQAAPSTSPGTYLVFNAVDVNDVGAVAFRSRIDHPVIADTTALFVNDGVGTTLLAEQGELAPGTLGLNYVIPGPPAINDGGDVAFHAGLDSGGMGLFLADGGVVAPVVLSTDAMPIGGAYGAFYAVDLDDAGRVWFVTGSSGFVIMVSEAGVETALVQLGDATPVGGTFSGFGAIAAGGSGQLAFQASVTGGSSPTGIFLRSASGTITALAVQGGAAPDTGGGMFANMALELSAPSQNDEGDVAFGAPVFGGTASSGVFRLPAGGSLEAVAVEGDSVPSHPLSDYSEFSAPSLDEDGVAAYRAELFGNEDTDTDGDGYEDDADNCLLVVNPTQCDTDQDGWGNHCDGDFNQSAGIVAATDYTTRFMPDFKAGADVGIADGTDMDCNGAVNATDFTQRFLPLFKKGMNGPSGLSCAGTIPCPPDL